MKRSIKTQLTNKGIRVTEEELEDLAGRLKNIYASIDSKETIDLDDTDVVVRLSSGEEACHD